MKHLEQFEGEKMIEWIDDNSSTLLGVDAETDDWKALGHCMDVIGECWDDGVSSGFVRANWTLLDRHLVTIINQAKKARKLLRPNAMSERPKTRSERTA